MNLTVKALAVSLEAATLLAGTRSIGVEPLVKGGGIFSNNALNCILALGFVAGIVEASYTRARHAETTGGETVAVQLKALAVLA